MPNEKKPMFSNIQRADIKFKWGIAVLLLIGFAAWYYTQPHTSGSSILGLGNAGQTTGSGTALSNVVVENDAQAGEELASASRSAVSSSGSVDDALDLLSSGS